MHCELLNSNDPWEIESILTLVDLLLYCTCINNNVFCISGYVANGKSFPQRARFRNVSFSLKVHNAHLKSRSRQSYMENWDFKISLSDLCSITGSCWQEHWNLWKKLNKPIKMSISFSYHTGTFSPVGYFIALITTQIFDNIGIIANFVSWYICSFLVYLDYMMLINVNLYVRRCILIILQDCIHILV